MGMDNNNRQVGINNQNVPREAYQEYSWLFGGGRK
jgi:hypothetical protein